ncbi:MAG TPA: hypothetical protein VJC10_02370 [Patescibacteria group bacterium]|nr:hypothetical protein [Patescibacteria group bacterium]
MKDDRRELRETTWEIEKIQDPIFRSIFDKLEYVGEIIRYDIVEKTRIRISALEKYAKMKKDRGNRSYEAKE